MAICPGPREIAYLSSPKPAEEILELPGPGLGRLPRTPLLETVWKIAGWLLDCGHGRCKVSEIALLGL